MTMHYRHIKELIKRTDEESKMSLRPVLFFDWMRMYLDAIPNRRVYYALNGDMVMHKEHCLYESADPIMWFFSFEGEHPYRVYYAIGFHLVDIVKELIKPNTHDSYVKRRDMWWVKEDFANVFQTYVLHLSWNLSLSGYKFNKNDFNKRRFNFYDGIKELRRKLMAYIMMYIYTKAGRKHRYLYFDKQNNIEIWKLESTQEIF